MTTACDTTRMVILEALTAPSGDAARHDVAVHVRECPSCAEFSRCHRDLDQRLSVGLPPPSPSHQVRRDVRRQIRLDAQIEWNERLPDLVHFAGCGAATAVCSLLLPLDASATIVVGFAGALLTYAALAMARSWLEDA